MNMTKHFRNNSVEIPSKSDIWASLNLVPLFPETQLKKIIKKRESLKQQLSEQILMATNRSYSPMKYRWITDSDGHVRRVAVPIKLKKWWREIPTGKMQLCIYVRGKVLELEAGKSAIEIATYSELVPTLKLIQDAVDLGDFDKLI
jgi:hypothetical protein